MCCLWCERRVGVVAQDLLFVIEHEKQSVVNELSCAIHTNVYVCFPKVLTILVIFISNYEDAFSTNCYTQKASTPNACKCTRNEYIHAPIHMHIYFLFWICSAHLNQIISTNIDIGTYMYIHRLCAYIRMLQLLCMEWGSRSWIAEQLKSAQINSCFLRGFICKCKFSQTTLCAVIK